MRKRTRPANDKFHDLHRHLTWFHRHFSEHEVIVEIDSPNSIHAFNRFEEEGHVKSRYNHLRLIDLTRDEFYAMVVPAILDDEEE